MEHVNAPTRDQVQQILRQLLDCEITPEEASDWARPWVTKLEEVDDATICEALTALAAADMPTTDREYLFGPADFEAWMRELMG